MFFCQGDAQPVAQLPVDKPKEGDGPSDENRLPAAALAPLPCAALATHRAASRSSVTSLTNQED